MGERENILRETLQAEIIKKKVHIFIWYGTKTQWANDKPKKIFVAFKTKDLLRNKKIYMENKVESK